MQTGTAKPAQIALWGHLTGYFSSLQGSGSKPFFLSHLRTFRIPNYCCDWKLPGQPFYAYVMARWMAEHEVLAAAIFVALSLALTALFAAMERHYEQQLTARRKNDFS